jgi:tetratricopeptide (TPR) repeat protein
VNPLRTVLPATALALALALAGCSGDAPHEAATAETPPAAPSAVEPAPLPLDQLDVEFYSEPPQEARTDAPSESEPAAATEPADAPVRAPAPTPLDELRAAVERDPANVAARRALGNALRQAGQHQEAVLHFEQALELDPGPRSLFELGVAYAGASRLDDAERAYRRVLAVMPNDPRTLHNLGNLAVRRDAPDTAIDFYRAAIEADDKYILAYYHLGNLLNTMGNQRAAYGAYLTVLEHRPRNPREARAYNGAVLQLAALSMALGDPAKAESLLSQLVQAYPDHRQAHYALGQALMALGRQEEAERELAIHMQLMAEEKPTSATAEQD